MIIKKKIKVGIIIDDGPVPYNIWKLIELSLEQKEYEVSKIFVQKNEIEKNKVKKIINLIKSRGIRKLFRQALFKLVKSFETFLIKIAGFNNVSDVFDTKDINQLNIISEKIYPKISKSGYVYTYNQSECKKIRKSELDILIRGGSGILKGEILQICSNGIISFHHADNDVNRGGPPGFWEVYLQNDYTGFIIQRLSEELDGGEILFRGKIQTSFFYILNWARVYKKSIIFLNNLLMNLSNSNQIKQVPQKQYDYPLYTVPTIKIQLHYIFKILSTLFSRGINKIFFIRNRWGIAFQFSDRWDNIVLRKSKKIKNPKNRFFADPFIIKYNNKNFIFVEDFYYKKNKGVISAIEIISKNKYKILGTVLEEDFHLSYPFIFKINDEIYMCPESHQSNDIRIYKCDEFPLKWNLHKIIMKNVVAADSNIFYFNNKWWLMTNICSSNISDRGSELHIYSSDSFDSSNWKKHPMNTVIFDSRSARNGGRIISKNGKVYRVFQKQEFDNYGARFGISEIIELNLLSYKEKILFESSPNYFPKIRGTHTFSFEEDIAVHDFYEKQFSL
jgi:hypothetical protein